jgi:hypothetical protein
MQVKSKVMVRKSVNSSGLHVAVKLYGSDCVINYGNAYTPGVVSIPSEDEESFDELVSDFSDWKG